MLFRRAVPHFIVYEVDQYLHFAFEFRVCQVAKLDHLLFPDLYLGVKQIRGVLFLWLDHFNLVDFEWDKAESDLVTTWHYENSMDIFQRSVVASLI